MVGSDPERAGFTLRLALNCTLTLLVAQIYETPDPALTIYITFFLNKPDRTTSLIMNVAFVIIITILIGIVFLIADHVLNDPAGRLAAMAVVSFLLLSLTSASKLKPIGSIAALIIVYALAVLGTVPAGELATRGLLYAWLFVGIPAGVSLIVNLLFAPSPRKLVDRAMPGRLRAAARRRSQPHAVEGSSTRASGPGSNRIARTRPRSPRRARGFQER